ncbi:unnamed protein product, partial [Ectocarpus sp. 12 AP-2014]
HGGRAGLGADGDARGSRKRGQECRVESRGQPSRHLWTGQVCLDLGVRRVRGGLRVRDRPLRPH